VRNHRITGSLIYIEDITEKRSRESRLRQAENLASLTTLAAGVAHEIKNPHGSISIHLQLMRKALAKNQDTSLNRYLSVLNEEVERLNHTVVDFLFAVRPVSLELREGSVNRLVAELIDFVRPELEQSKIRCVLNLDDAVPPFLMDERYMKQALLNLIKNAQAAMEGGGSLTVKSELAENEIRLSIRDTGVGISGKNLSKIFDPYFTTKETGTGLGLTLAFKIVREHRGEINVQSREGEGSCFTISLPLTQKERRLIAWESKDGVKR
jgi:signal transduction histidine kinase